ncbi:MAG: restriction endonuclease subunit M [Spirochaetes bacterium GWB1_59_5]|nr:MAG: restriction endonuclease subunit M [Spirochaetes bacterium GWB1_59_5]
MNQAEIAFLNSLETKLWASANKLLPNLDAARYKHVMLGLVFLKYVSDAFDVRVQELKKEFIDPDADYFLGIDADAAFINSELENRDYYTEKNVFWVPESARWKNIEQNCRLSLGTNLPWGDEFKGVSKLLDDAMAVIEKENPKLKNILFKDFAREGIEDQLYGSLISDVVGTIPFNHDTLGSKDILGHVYEYFLGEFASAEGKKGGQFYTPKSIVSLIVEILKPYAGRVYDPAMGSGGFFVQSEKFIEAHGDKRGTISVYGQESNSTTWRLAAMNMAIRGIDFNFGSEPANTFTRDLHPDLRADFVMANPPFNQDEWWDEKLANDRRWQGFPTPPKRNANFAWLLHMLSHLNENGSMGLLLANGSMSSATNGEGEIRKKLLENDLIECMISLPGQLFTNTQIPACIWFLTKNKKERTTPAGAFRDRRGHVLFIDARNLGRMASRVQRVFDDTDIQKIAMAVDSWKTGHGYADEAGFCKSANADELRKNDFVLTPGRYVGSADIEVDTEPFDEKMVRLTKQLGEQFSEGTKLEKEIRKQLASIGFEVPIL